MSGSDTEQIDRICDAFGARADRDAAIGPLTTLRVGGRADVLVRAQTIDDLALLATVAGDVSVMAVGQGSNLLVGDEGIRGVVVVLEGAFAEWTVDSVDRADEDSVGGAVLAAGAALKLPMLARQSVREGWSGLEWMVGVPGSVGGAVRMNAGGHGSDVAASLVSVTVFDTRSATIDERPASSLGLSYRHSSLVDGEIVLRASLRVACGDAESGERELAEIVRWRREHQPGGANCGSVFTNPPGDSAGRLIDATGLKGLRIGSAEVSTKHANFIQADPGGRAADVWALIREVRRRVHAQTGVVLTPEVRTVGFDAALDDLTERLSDHRTDQSVRTSEEHTP